MKLETINIKGYDVEISIDDWQENPREWDFYSSTLVTDHPKYTLGGIKLTDDAWSTDDAFNQHLADEELTLNDIICHKVYLYEHSGIALSTKPFCTGCWDNRQSGYIYEKRSDIRAEFGVKRISPKLERQILNRLSSEIDILEHWANGNVYAFIVEDESCGGFYGYDHEESGLIEAATDAVNAIRRYKLREHTTKLKQLIKAGVGLQYRPTLDLHGASL